MECSTSDLANKRPAFDLDLKLKQRVLQYPCDPDPLRRVLKGVACSETEETTVFSFDYLFYFSFT
jgi:hypothetical protein